MKQDNSDNAKTAVRNAIRMAKSKASAARTVLNALRIPPDEAVPALWSGWCQIAAAVSLPAGDSQPGDPRAAIRTAIAPGGVLSSIPDGVLAEMEWLEAAHEKYRTRQSCVVPRVKFLEALGNFDRAVRYADKWCRQSFSSARSRLGRRIFLVFLAVFVLCAICLIVHGTYKGVSAPASDEGLIGTYFVRSNFAGHPFRRVDHHLNFRWKKYPPVKGLRGPRFSVYWEGCVVVEEGGHRRLFASGYESSVTVFIDGVREGLSTEQPDKEKENESSKRFKTKFVSKPIAPGVHRLRVEYPNAKVPGGIFVGWKPDTGEPVPIEARELVPDGGNANFSCPSPSGGKKK